MAIVEYAKSFVGTGYRYGGRDKTGFDCSGFTCHVMNHFGISIPVTSKLQSDQGQKIHWKKAQPGDLIFFGRRGKINHVGIVTQNTGRKIYVVHSTSSSGVKVDEIVNNAYWAPRIFGAASYLNRPRLRWESTGED
jgi:cell wall-associated NlpC family hydrolase